ncbi:alkaline phosphatase family protein [Marinicauda pacifica]|nr:ectonucleotide pyrophosphatase/phosphodiesterase [Marinicauda pacifica]GGE40957.1 alkaline phosphatase family protein [Marinicauda pacifica]
MMTARFHTLGLGAFGLGALALSACASQGGEAPRMAQADEGEIVLMIGLDGLRADFIDLYDAPNLQALAARGVRAEAMIPVMPSVTFVNFYSLATGLYPESHGLVTNAPYDREFDTVFENGVSTQEERWWGGEPIWITAERQGVRSGVMFWVGSETQIDGQHASDWSVYEHEKPYDERVETVLSWFDRPASEQPRFAAVYFDRVDTVAHREGPEHPLVAEAVADVDARVGALVAGLEARGLLERTNIIVVSDHGMTEIDPDNAIALDTIIDFDTVFVPEMEGRGGAGHRPFAMVYGEPDAIDAAYAALDGAHEHMRVWRRGETPEDYHFNHETRGPDLFVLADTGWSLTAPSLWSRGYPPYPGVHGYDNHHPDMAATFVAAGPMFENGVTVPAFENVNVHAVIACGLGIEPAETEADPATVERLTGGRCPAP